MDLLGLLGGAATGIYALFVAVVSLGLLVLKVLVVIDVVRRDAQVFPAVDRQTKQIWLIFSIGALVGHLLSPNPTALLNLVGTIAAVVYWVDVRKRINDLFNNRW